MDSLIRARRVLPWPTGICLFYLRSMRILSLVVDDECFPTLSQLLRGEVLTESCREADAEITVARMSSVFESGNLVSRVVCRRKGAP